MLTEIFDHQIGSDGWLIKGLSRPEYSEAFAKFLGGNLIPCIEICKQYSDEDFLGNLLGIALIRRAEAALESAIISGCREIASCISLIPDNNNRGKTEKLLEEMVCKRIKTYMDNGQEEEVITFIREVLDNASHGLESHLIRLSEVKDRLSDLYLNRSINNLLNKDIDGFDANYNLAIKYAKDKKVCEQKFNKAVESHVATLCKRRDFSEALNFLADLKSKFPKLLLLQAFEFFVKAEQRCDRLNEIDRECISLIEKAYEADPNHVNLAEVYSNYLTAYAFSFIESIEGMTDGYEITTIITKVRDLLEKALRVGNNPNARELLEVIQSKF